MDMITVDKNIKINRPVAEVFNFLLTPNNIPKWRPDVVQIIDPPTAPLNTGVTFKEKVKGFGVFTMQITDLQPGKQISLKAIEGPKARQTQMFIFNGNAGGTTLNIHVAVEISGFLKLIEPMLRSKINKKWELYLINAKKIIETPAQS